MQISKTSLYDIHKANNAKIVDYAGWQMPVFYTGIKQENIGVRKSAGLFDVSHMGEILITGNDALDLCQFLTTNDLSKIKDNQVQYSLMCDNKGGVIDDLLIYRINTNKLLLCVNAVNTNKDFNWIIDNSGHFDVEIHNVSSSYSQLALQGPKSIEIIKKVLGNKTETIKRFHFQEIKWGELQLLVSRTGYTGEDGFEIYLPWNNAPQLWIEIQEEGGDDLLLCGLGSRDTLRLEMGYSLYGFEIDEDINPLEAGLDKYVKLNKKQFIGKKVLEEYVKTGFGRKQVAFEMIDKGFPRHGYEIYIKDEVAGFVTSGTFSPSLDKFIGLGIVNSSKMKNNEISVDIRNNKRVAQIVSLPFYMK